MSLTATASGTQQTQAIKPHRTFEGHSNWVKGVIHLPEGQWIMTCSGSSLRVWNLQTAQQVGNDWQDGESFINSIALSLDGKKVASGSYDGSVRLWNVDTGKVIAKWTGHTNEVNSVCWNRDSGQVVSGSTDATARVWDVESGETVLAIETGLAFVRAVIYSPDTSRMIATGGHSWGSGREFLKVWDADTGKLVADLKGHKKQVFCLAWTEDGTTLISGSDDHSIRTWNTTTWQQTAVLTEHTDTVSAIAISPKGRIFASASHDHTTRLWNLENGQPIGSPLQNAGSVLCVSFSIDGKLLATGCWDNNAYSWDIAVIAKEAGANELLLNSNSGDKLLSDANTRCPGQQREPENARHLPPGFFNDSPHPQPSKRSTSSLHQHPLAGHEYLSLRRRTLFARISSLFQRNNYNTHDAPTRPSFLEWAQNFTFHSQNGRNDESVQLQERSPAVVEVPLAHGNFRNYSAREARRKQEKEKENARNAKIAKKEEKKKGNIKNTTNAPASSSRPSPSDVAQQSGGGTQAQPTSELHSAAVSTLSTTSAIAAPSAVTTRWTHFWSAACCISIQNAN